MYAPSKPGDQPSVEVSKEFMMSPNKLHLGKNQEKKIHRSVLFTLPSYVIRLDSNVYCGNVDIPPQQCLYSHTLTNILVSECSLDKELYYHGETISVNVHIQVTTR